jgi:hypothetical protein
MPIKIYEKARRGNYDSTKRNFRNRHSRWITLETSSLPMGV